jgi:hypothetical protein
MAGAICSGEKMIIHSGVDFRTTPMVMPDYDIIFKKNSVQKKEEHHGC